MIHHFSHEVDIGHEDGRVALLEEEAKSLKTSLKLFVLC